VADTPYYYEPRHGHGLVHDPLNAIIAPRPIGWISSCSAEGWLNLAPYSFFNAFNYVPPIIGFASIGYKDSVRNIEQTREFGWSLVTLDLAEAMNQTCASVPANVSEFELAGLTPAPSRLISVPRVAQSPVSFECRCTQIIQLQNADGEKLKSWLVLGEIIAVHIARSYLKDGVYDTASAGHVLRGGGAADYFCVGKDQLFRMKRPT